MIAKEGERVEVRPRRMHSSYPVWVFLFFLTIFSAGADALIIHSHHETAPLSRFVMWCPGFAAFCSCWVLRIPTSSLGWRWPSTRWLRLAYGLPLLYALPVYLLTWAIVPHAFALKSFEATMVAPYGLGGWPALGTLGVALPLTFSISVIGTMTWALGEELGWRGLLFPGLNQGLGFHGACLLSGAIWTAWHYPGLLWADYNAGTNPVFAIGCFTVMVIGLGYLMGYLRLRSSSIWPCVLLHATHNTFIQGILDALTAPVGRAKYITTEFGAGLATTIVVAAVLLIRSGAVRNQLLHQE